MSFWCLKEEKCKATLFSCDHAVLCFYIDRNNSSMPLIRTFVFSQRNIWPVSVSWWITHWELSAVHTARHAMCDKGKIPIEYPSSFFTHLLSDRKETGTSLTLQWFLNGSSFSVHKEGDTQTHHSKHYPWHTSVFSKVTSSDKATGGKC